MRKTDEKSRHHQHLSVDELHSWSDRKREANKNYSHLQQDASNRISSTAIKVRRTPYTPTSLGHKHTTDHSKFGGKKSYATKIRLQHITKNKHIGKMVDQAIYSEKVHSHHLHMKPKSAGVSNRSKGGSFRGAVKGGVIAPSPKGNVSGIAANVKLKITDIRKV